MRTKEQIREQQRKQQAARRSTPPTGLCECSRPAKYWTSSYEAECEVCRALETAQAKCEILGAPQRTFAPESSRVVYVPLYKRFKVSIQEFANSILVHAHGDYTLKIQ
jgi:hypothetical protein